MPKQILKRKYNELTLDQQKVVIDELGRGVSSRKLAAKFNVTKSTINNIRARETQISELLEKNISFNRKRKFSEKANFTLNNKTFEFFSMCRGKNIPISGPMLQSAALKIAENLKLYEFRASNGWLESFRKAFQIQFKVITGESADVNKQVVDRWVQHLPEICKGYSIENIFNADETALFYKQLPTKTLTHKIDEAKGGKLRKERLTTLLCASLAGEKLPLLVIGNAAYPRVFKQNNILVNRLPVGWTSNKKAWMTANIFTQWITEVNKKMAQQKRNILLFVDNASSHPKLKLSNIELKFLPPNTTSSIQPLDQGVIRTLKIKYRWHLMNKLIATAENCQNSSEFSKSINVLDAIRWLAASWNEVRGITIQQCFQKAGFHLLQGPLEVLDNEDDLKNLSDMFTDQNFITNLTIPEEFISFDNNLQVHDECPNTIEEILQHVLVSENVEDEEVDSIGEDLCIMDEPSTPSFSEAMTALKTVIRYAASLADCKVLNSLLSTQCELEKLETERRIKTYKQTEITEFFR